MTEVSPTRLWVMRAMYLVMAAGIGLTVWPLILSHSSAVPRMCSVRTFFTCRESRASQASSNW